MYFKHKRELLVNYTSQDPLSSSICLTINKTLIFLSKNCHKLSDNLFNVSTV